MGHTHEKMSPDIADSVVLVQFSYVRHVLSLRISEALKPLFPDTSNIN
jgi:hypothetical protein